MNQENGQDIHDQGVSAQGVIQSLQNRVGQLAGELAFKDAVIEQQQEQIMALAKRAGEQPPSVGTEEISSVQSE